MQHLHDTPRGTTSQAESYPDLISEHLRSARAAIDAALILRESRVSPDLCVRLLHGTFDHVVVACQEFDRLVTFGEERP
jgi:hypothetical protein